MPMTRARRKPAPRESRHAPPLRSAAAEVGAKKPLHTLPCSEQEEPSFHGNARVRRGLLLFIDARRLAVSVEVAVPPDQVRRVRCRGISWASSTTNLSGSAM